MYRQFAFIHFQIIIIIKIIKDAQKEAFSDEYLALQKGIKLVISSKLFGLCPRLDKDGVIRLNTQVQYAEFLPYDVRHPIVLPRKHWGQNLLLNTIMKREITIQEQTKHCLCYQLNTGL